MKLLQKLILVFALVLGFSVMGDMQQPVDASVYLATTDNGSWYMDDTSATAISYDHGTRVFAVNIYLVTNSGKTMEPTTEWFLFQPSDWDSYTSQVSNDGHHFYRFGWNDTSFAHVMISKAFRAGWYATYGYGFS